MGTIPPFRFYKGVFELKYKKKIYPLMAVVLVLVLSLPRVAYASDQEEIITYECVEGNYGAGTVEKMMTCTAFQIPNSMYDYVTNLMQDCPVDYKSYDYYLVTLAPNSPILRVFCFNSPSAICVTYPAEYEDGVSEDSDYSEKDYNLLVSSYESVVSKVSTASDYDDLYGQSQYIYLTEGTGTYLTRTGASSSWSISYQDDTFSYSGDSKSYLTLGGAIIDTNLPVYHGYEMNKNGWHGNKTINKAFEVASSCTNLNLSNKRYNGSGYVGGAASYDNTIGFDSFTIEKINHPDCLGGSGALLNWSLTPETLEKINQNWAVRMSFTVNYSICEVEENGLLADSTSFTTGNYYETFNVDINSFVKQNGNYMYSLDNAYENGIITDGKLSIFLMCMSSNSIEYNYNSSFVGSVLNNFTGDLGMVLDTSSNYFFDYIEIVAEVQLFNESENILSNSAGGHVELVNGRNSAWCNKVIEDGTGEILDEDSVVEGNNYYNVETELDSAGNTYYNYYYYDTTNNTVTPSINTGSDKLTLYFATPLTIEGVSSSGGGSSSSSSNATVGGSGDNVNITIEDDDYTDTALREDLADGFGLFDDSETELKADGYLQMAAGFFNNIDPGLGAIIAFGISSSVVIGILRTALRR